MATGLLSELLAGFFRWLDIVCSMIGIDGVFRSVDTSKTNMFPVNVRFNSVSVTVVISPEWNVAQVKEAIVKELSKSRAGVAKPGDISIIFAGKKLPDDLKLADSDLGRNSVIHAVTIIKTGTPSNEDISMLSEKVISLNVVDDSVDSSHLKQDLQSMASIDDRRERRSYFFVYCPSCKDINSGKLRVRCNKCKQDTLILSRDPCCWKEVLRPNQVKGTCQSEQCQGTNAEFYFKCASEKHTDLDLSAVVLYSIRYNNRNVPCLACTDVADIVFVFPCAEAHVTCYDCFKSYCLSKLNERQFIIDDHIGYTLSCPVGCHNSFIEETHHFRIMGEDAYGKYQRFATEEYVFKTQGVLCPQPNCGAGMMLDTGELPCDKIVCESCSYVFCRHCRQGYHLGDCSVDSMSSEPLKPFDSAIDPLQAEAARWTHELSLKTIRGMTKPCPKCRTPTERDGGCMHITCTRAQCGFNWCWICQTEWTRNCMADHWFD